MRRLMRLGLGLLCMLVSGSLLASETPKVIYITLDGIAPVEMTKEHFPRFFKTILPHGEAIGFAGDKRSMEVASIPVSMPSYMSQMSGAVQDCDSNDCERIGVETMPEKIKRVLGLDKGKVATIASWSLIKLAVEHQEDATYTNCGLENLQLYGEGVGTLNYQQYLEPSPLADRKDRYTFALASIYLERVKPRFLWISLQDGDIFAHQNNREAFVDLLHEYDESLTQLVSFLSADENWRNTTLVLTTDHGRGRGDDWTHHGPAYPESKKTWLFVLNTDAVSAGSRQNMPAGFDKQHYSTLDIRPMIENLLHVSS